VNRVLQALVLRAAVVKSQIQVKSVSIHSGFYHVLCSLIHSFVNHDSGRILMFLNSNLYLCKSNITSKGCWRGIFAVCFYNVCMFNNAEGPFDFQ